VSADSRWRFGRVWHGLVLGLLVAVLSSCVYFNTFYNAEKYFRGAEKKRTEYERELGNRSVNQRARQTYEGLYEKAVRKASLVLDKHRESDLVDDAMFLIGRALYWKRDYQYASRSLQDLEDNFPNSEFLDQARYWRALCLDELIQPEEARALFRSLMSDRRPIVGALSGLRLGEMSDRDEDWNSAIQQYRSTLEAFPRTKLRSQLWLRIGRAHMALDEPGQVDSSLAAFSQALQADPPDSIEYRARLLSGQALYSKGDGEAALAVYEKLLREGRFRGWEGETRLLIGDYHRARADIDQALAEYEQIRDDFPQSDVSARALYETGLLYLRQEGDRLLASEYLEEVSKEKQGSIADSLAREMIKTFIALDDLLENVFEADSLAAVAMHPPQPEPELGPEIKEGQDPDSTGVDEVATLDSTSVSMPDTVVAEVSAVIGDTSSVAYEDTASYLPAFDETGRWQPLVTRPSLREQNDEEDEEERQRRIQQARSRRSRTARTETLEDQLFTVADLYRAGMEQADSAAHFYGVLAQRFPKSPHVPRALWNLAWVHSTLRQDRQAAERPMRRLIEEFPNTVHAGAARRFLGFDAIPSAEDLAAQEFLRLEAPRLETPEQVERWLPGLDSLIQAYPRTLTAAKAAFVVARTLETVRSQDSVEVEARFARIGDEFSHTRYGELVRLRTQSKRDGMVARLERTLQRLGEGIRPGERLTLLAVEPVEEDSAGFSRKFLGLGMRALRRGQFERAVEWFELSLEEKQTRNGLAHAGLGEAAWRQGYFSDAVEHFRTGLVNASTSVLPLHRLFEYHVREDNPDSANHYLRLTMRQDRDNIEVQRLVDRFPTLIRAEPEEVEVSELETVEIAPDSTALELSPGFFTIVEEPFVRESVQPLYPAEANGDSAQVVVDILINEDGEPELVDVFSGDEPFVTAALAAARRYRFYAAEGRNEFLMPVWVELALTLKPPSISPPAIADAGEPAGAAE